MDISIPSGRAIPSSWRLSWAHGQAEVQSLGAMLGPVTFHVGGSRSIQIMQVAPWAEHPEASSLPGLLRRLRGEWPCVPFGRTDLPEDLPVDWQRVEPSDQWPHGYASNHEWTCEEWGPEHIRLSIKYPDSGPIEKIEREIRADPSLPALDVRLTVYPRSTAWVPVALHPTFRIPPSVQRVQIELASNEGIHTYPSSSAGRTRLRPDCRADSLLRMPGPAGPLDLSRLSLAEDSEELVQVCSLKALPGESIFALHYLDEAVAVTLDWNTQDFPDLMLWISNRGRAEFPWQGQHLALGAEPVNGPFDLGRVARPPQGHPMADRRGVHLQTGQPWTTRYRVAAKHRK